MQTKNDGSDQTSPLKIVRLIVQRIGIRTCRNGTTLARESLADAVERLQMISNTFDSISRMSHKRNYLNAEYNQNFAFFVQKSVNAIL